MVARSHSSTRTASATTTPNMSSRAMYTVAAIVMIDAVRCCARRTVEAAAVLDGERLLEDGAAVRR